MPRPRPRPDPLADAALVTTAVVRAASRLGLSNRSLARVLGVSEATVSRMGGGAYLLKRGDKAFELALLFLRMFRALDALAGGDEQVGRAWLRNENLALGGVPAARIESLAGLIDVVGYLDAHRALG
ncbi:MAG TPA: MbcA/ParS/Xre antitoxin family protein [Vicinamibacterales bacterium]|nr:MbcA/ParS/Xre antitoxin family protein [Vicinamibacterales bacterium]